MNCHCDHADDKHFSAPPFGCRLCPCLAYRRSDIEAGTWVKWSYDKQGRPEWRGIPAETLKERESMRYPLAPLMDFMKDRGGFEAVMENISDREVRKRWRNRFSHYRGRRGNGTIPEHSADEFCCLILGVTPESVWVEEATAA